MEDSEEEDGRVAEASAEPLDNAMAIKTFPEAPGEEFFFSQVF